jgi:hypothetical protein
METSILTTKSTYRNLSAQRLSERTVESEISIAVATKADTSNFKLIVFCVVQVVTFGFSNVYSCKISHATFLIQYSHSKKPFLCVLYISVNILSLHRFLHNTFKAFFKFFR